MHLLYGYFTIYNIFSTANFICPAAKTSTPTITTQYPFYKTTDVKKIYKAIKGAGTDEQAVIDVLTHRTYKQRNEICDAFTKRYNYDCRSWLVDNEFGGAMWDIMDNLMRLPTHALAKHLLWAVKGAATHEQTLIDILVPMTAKEKRSVKTLFKRKSGYTLRNYVRDDTAGSDERGNC